MKAFGQTARLGRNGWKVEWSYRLDPLNSGEMHGRRNGWCSEARKECPAGARSRNSAELELAHLAKTCRNKRDVHRGRRLRQDRVVFAVVALGKFLETTL